MSKYYESMTLEGSRADAAIDCMRDEKILEPRSLRQRLDGFILGRLQTTVLYLSLATT